MINTFTILSCIFICFAVDAFIIFSIMENKIKRCKDVKHLLPILKYEDKILYLLLFFMACAFLFTSTTIMLLI